VAIDPSVYEFLAKEVTYPDGAVIVSEGGPGDWIYVILDGKAKVKKTTVKGQVTVDTLGEGEIFGEMALWQTQQRVRSASIVADGPVRLGVLDSERLRRDYEALSPRLKALIRTLILRLKETTDRVVAIATDTEF
jgi:CRP-like cAMP-binding protein